MQTNKSAAPRILPFLIRERKLAQNGSSGARKVCPVGSCAVIRRSILLQNKVERVALKMEWKVQVGPPPMLFRGPTGVILRSDEYLTRLETRLLSSRLLEEDLEGKAILRLWRKTLEKISVSSDEELLEAGFSARNLLFNTITSVLMFVPVRGSDTLIFHWLKQGKYDCHQAAYAQVGGEVVNEFLLEVIRKRGKRRKFAAHLIATWGHPDMSNEVRSIVFTKSIPSSLRAILAKFFSSMILRYPYRVEEMLHIIVEILSASWTESERAIIEEHMVHTIAPFSTSDLKLRNLLRDFLKDTSRSYLINRLRFKSVLI